MALEAIVRLLGLGVGLWAVVRTGAVKASAWLTEMERSGCPTTIVTYSSVLNAYASQGNADEA
eukprot:5249622-Amphidinium_carterae.1